MEYIQYLLDHYENPEYQGDAGTDAIAAKTLHENPDADKNADYARTMKYPPPPLEKRNADPLFLSTALSFLFIISPPFTIHHRISSRNRNTLPS